MQDIRFSRVVLICSALLLEWSPSSRHCQPCRFNLLLWPHPEGGPLSASVSYHVPHVLQFSLYPFACWCFAAFVYTVVARRQLIVRRWMNVLPLGASALGGLEFMRYRRGRGRLRFAPCAAIDATYRLARDDQLHDADRTEQIASCLV